MVVIMKASLRAPIWIALLAGGVIAAASGYLTLALAVSTGLAAFLVILLSRSQATVQHLREQANTDALTGLANYRQLIESLGGEIARSSRRHGLFSVLFVDMCGLKRINDRHGHVAGSWALCRLAEALRRSCRTVDTPARFGGDEFAIILPETSQVGAEQLAVRLTALLSADPRTPSLSISVGVGEFPRDGVTPAALLAAAGRDLCERKSWQLESGDRSRKSLDRPDTKDVSASPAITARFERAGRPSKPS
jgi:diguanylate cyclase (GGDEF)-like protein